MASWTPAAERVTGYTSGEIIGLDFLTLCTPEQIENGRPQRGLKIAAAGGLHEEEDWRLRYDGSRFWASVLTTALRDDRGQLRGFARVIRDITERKIVESGFLARKPTVRATDCSCLAERDLYLRYAAAEECFCESRIAEALGYDPAQRCARGAVFPIRDITRTTTNHSALTLAEWPACAMTKPHG